MATNKKISELPYSGTLTGSEEVEILQAGANKRTALTVIRDLFDTTPSNHNNLSGLEAASSGVTWGHINDTTQTIYGAKTINSGTSNTALSLLSSDTTINLVMKDDATTGSGFAITRTGDKTDILTADITRISIAANGKVSFITTPTAETATANPPLTRDISTGEIKTGGKQVVSVASDTTPNPTGWAYENEYYLTALAGAAAFEAPSGTPVNGNTLMMRIKDNGTARALIWNAIYKGFSQTLPSTTILGKEMYLGFIYNSASSKWDLVSLINQI